MGNQCPTFWVKRRLSGNSLREVKLRDHIENAVTWETHKMYHTKLLLFNSTMAPGFLFPGTHTFYTLYTLPL
jgi:hypothetical protein